MKPYQQKETLDRLYRVEGRSSEEIAEELDCSPRTVLRWLKRHGIPVRSNGGETRDAPWKDEERLRSLYQDDELPVKDIADRLGCSPTTIHHWMDKFDIPKRSYREANRRERAPYRTDHHGYETWRDYNPDGTDPVVRVHRLLAVAEHGPDAVSNREVHHVNGVKWDNRPGNIEILSPAEHRRRHADNNGSTEGSA